MAKQTIDSMDKRTKPKFWDMRNERTNRVFGGIAAAGVGATFFAATSPLWIGATLFLGTPLLILDGTGVIGNAVNAIAGRASGKVKRELSGDPTKPDNKDKYMYELSPIKELDILVNNAARRDNKNMDTKIDFRDIPVMKNADKQWAIDEARLGEIENPEARNAIAAMAAKELLSQASLERIYDTQNKLFGKYGTTDKMFDSKAASNGLYNAVTTQSEAETLKFVLENQTTAQKIEKSIKDRNIQTNIDKFNSYQRKENKLTIESYKKMFSKGVSRKEAEKEYKKGARVFLNPKNGKPMSFGQFKNWMRNNQPSTSRKGWFKSSFWFMGNVVRAVTTGVAGLFNMITGKTYRDAKKREAIKQQILDGENEAAAEAIKTLSPSNQRKLEKDLGFTFYQEPQQTAAYEKNHNKLLKSGAVEPDNNVRNLVDYAMPAVLQPVLETSIAAAQDAIKQDNGYARVFISPIEITITNSQNRMVGTMSISSPQVAKNLDEFIASIAKDDEYQKFEIKSGDGKALSFTRSAYDSEQDEKGRVRNNKKALEKDILNAIADLNTEASLRPESRLDIANFKVDDTSRLASLVGQTKTAGIWAKTTKSRAELEREYKGFAGKTRKVLETIGGFFKRLVGRERRLLEVKTASIPPIETGNDIGAASIPVEGGAAVVSGPDDTAINGGDDKGSNGDDKGTTPPPVNPAQEEPKKPLFKFVIADKEAEKIDDKLDRLEKYVKKTRDMGIVRPVDGKEVKYKDREIDGGAEHFRMDSIHKHTNAHGARNLSARAKAWFDKNQDLETNLTIYFEQKLTQISKSVEAMRPKVDELIKVRSELVLTDKEIAEAEQALAKINAVNPAEANAAELTAALNQNRGRKVEVTLRKNTIESELQEMMDNVVKTRTVVEKVKTIKSDKTKTMYYGTKVDEKGDSLSVEAPVYKYTKNKWQRDADREVKDAKKKAEDEAVARNQASQQKAMLESEERRKAELNK